MQYDSHRYNLLPLLSSAIYDTVCYQLTHVHLMIERMFLFHITIITQSEVSCNETMEYTVSLTYSYKIVVSSLHLNLMWNVKITIEFYLPSYPDKYAVKFNVNVHKWGVGFLWWQNNADHPDKSGYQSMICLLITENNHSVQNHDWYHLGHWAYYNFRTHNFRKVLLFPKNNPPNIIYIGTFFFWNGLLVFIWVSS